MKKLRLVLLGAIILLLFSSRALIIEVKPESVPSFEDTKYPIQNVI
ncbi:hypothetical protein VFC49_01155 [Thermococcus sp. SY098]|nr:hypothetical protein [Thermococcus sp. SY098]WRS52803.1 hypothetical protein VFC49_01155 [Thermococcus sp. SY098]